MAGYVRPIQIGHEAVEHIDLDVSSCDEETSEEEGGVRANIRGEGRGDGRDGGGRGAHGASQRGERGTGGGGRQPYGIPAGPHQAGPPQSTPVYPTYATPSQAAPLQFVPEAHHTYRPPSMHPNAAARHAPPPILKLIGLLSVPLK